MKAKTVFMVLGGLSILWWLNQTYGTFGGTLTHIGPRLFAPGINRVTMATPGVGSTIRTSGYDKSVPEVNIGDRYDPNTQRNLLVRNNPEDVNTRLLEITPGKAIIPIDLPVSLLTGSVTFEWVDSTFTYVTDGGERIEYCATGKIRGGSTRGEYLMPHHLIGEHRLYFLRPDIPVLAMAYRVGHEGRWHWIGHSDNHSYPSPLEGLAKTVGLNQPKPLELSLNCRWVDGEDRHFLPGDNLVLRVRYYPNQQPGKS